MLTFGIDNNWCVRVNKKVKWCTLKLQKKYFRKITALVLLAIFVATAKIAKTLEW